MVAILALVTLACALGATPVAQTATAEVTILPYSSPTGAQTATADASPTSTAPPTSTARPTVLPPATSPPASVTATSAPVDTQQASAAGATATPFGCQAPDDDYTRVSVGDGMVINQRTYDMLAYAQTLFSGTHNFIKSITQGSYNPGVAASFGTHDGGGAVDISVRDPNTFAVLTDQLQPMVTALREAGFAAWVREENELSQGSPIHIHMIAVGDKEMSAAARRQIDGKEGYFRGFNGLPVDPPAPDKWGPPIVCPWMVALGYSDLRGK